jgi:CHAT domain-containing protein
VKNQNEDAIIKLKKSIEIFEGRDMVNEAGALTNLGLAELDRGDLESSLKNLQKAISIYAKNFGPDHPRTLDALRALSGFYAQTGQYSQALAARHKILEICIKNYGHYNIKTTFAFADLGSAYSLNRDYKNSIENYEKAISTFTKLKIDNYYLQEIYEGTALSYYMIDQYNEATRYVLMSLNSRINQLHNVLIADEKTRLEWHRKFSSVGIAPCFLPANLINKYTFFSKGLVFDSVAEDRAMAARGDGSGLLKQLESLRAEISQTTLNTNLKTDSDIEKLVFQSLQIENEISKFSTVAGRTRRSSIIKLEQAIDALPPSSCFINFIEFWDPKIQTPSSFVLGAILTLKEHDPIFVRIGEMASIYRSIRALRTAMNNGDTSGFDEQTSWLSEKLWSPIAAKIPQQVNRLIISPDGELNFLSFAALLDAQGKFLAETHDISYMGSARDLVRETKSMPSRTLRLFANPAFQRAPSEVKGTQLTMRSAEIDLFGQLQLPPLPGTEKESAEIQKIATDDGWQLQTFSQEQADEQALRKTKNPGILHLATHGFYLNSFAPAPLDSRGMSVISLEKAKLNTNGVDPMRASGIALAGAQSTLKSWSERKAPSPEADGVLTAEEVAALDLDGTWLVTLSACETGVGEARSGEGVLGLRRSFMMAGAENLLMTLWPVSDQTTSEIMADFYREALKTRNAPGSLAKVQREWLVKLRKEKGLLEAVRDAGPFVMATIGKPLPPLPREPAKEPSILDKVTQKIESLIKSSNTDIKNN